MKKALKVILFAAAVLMVTGCAKKGPAAGKSEPTKINLWSFTDEIPGMVEKFQSTHPELNFELNTTIIATTNQEYEPALIPALQNGEVDIYGAESAFVLKYTQGDMADYAAPYKDLGIDIDAAIKKADIASYTVEIGTNPKGQVVGLGYQATGGCFIYNRTAAKKAFGSDDPKAVEAAIGGGSQSWDKFYEAAQKCADAGIAIVSGDGDIWHAYENSSDKGWIVNGKLYIDPKREAFLDASKALIDNNWSNDTTDWTEAWYADMAEVGEKPCLGFFGPAWLINYVMAGNSGDTYGDWAVCNSPIGFFWGGTWVLAGKGCLKDENKKAITKAIIEWITLDPTSNGLLYQWANGTYQWAYGKGADPSVNTKDAVSSGTVMSISDGKLDFLKGQNMFDYFVPAGAYANGKNLTQYDSDINALWRDQVRAYAHGQKSRDAAIADFKQGVADKFGIN